MKLRLQILEARAPTEVAAAVSAATKGAAGALLVLGGPMFFGEHARIVDLAAKSRLPLMAPQRDTAARSWRRRAMNWRLTWLLSAQAECRSTPWNAASPAGSICVSRSRLGLGSFGEEFLAKKVLADFWEFGSLARLPPRLKTDPRGGGFADRVEGIEAGGTPASSREIRSGDSGRRTLGAHWAGSAGPRLSSRYQD